MCALVTGVQTCALPIWLAREGAGVLTAPVDATGAPGVDLLTQTPEIAGFLRTPADGMPLTVGSYAYADGPRHVPVVHASDALTSAYSLVGKDCASKCRIPWSAHYSQKKQDTDQS